jgi:hypothetical protein
VIFYSLLVSLPARLTPPYLSYLMTLISFISLSMLMIFCLQAATLPCYAHKSHATQQRLCSLFIDKHVSCRAHPWSPIFQDIVGHFLPHDLHDLSGLFTRKWCGMIPQFRQLGEHLSYTPTFCPHDTATSPTFYPHEAATSPTFCMSTRQSQLPILLRQLLT